MPLTPQDVHSKVFGPTRFRRGYDEAEVDAFLDEVETELLRLHREIDALRNQRGSDGVAGASDALAEGTQESSAGTTAGEAQAAAMSLSKDDDRRADDRRADDRGDLEQRVARTLVLAQRAADEALHDAETQAEQMRREAQAEVDRLRAEAQEAAARERAQLEGERSSAQDDVEQLRAFEREYRTRLRAYLELQLRELDGSGAAQVENRPAPALPADAGAGARLAGPSGGGSAAAGPSTPQHPTPEHRTPEHPTPEQPGEVSEAPTRAGQEHVGAYAGFAVRPGTAEYPAGGVSDRAAGDELGHEPPRDGV
jgi:DivIVA domain-containing protein